MEHLAKYPQQNRFMSRIQMTQPGIAQGHRGGNVPMRAIRHFARQVARHFRPGKIILFGSYAYGTPNEDSDVDILVVMPCRNQIDQAIKIHSAIGPPFSLDLIVRTPSNLGWRLRDRESFHTEIVTRGKVLYESRHASGYGRPKRIVARHFGSQKEPTHCMIRSVFRASKW
jgi:uncharacterized protein